jgi:hypothetical protein
MVCPFIDSSGNVGIGTTAPADKLHIYNGYLRIDSPGLGWGTNQRIVSYGPLSFQPDTDNTGDPFIYFLNPAGSATVFINTNSGNVGIGTTNPGAKLDVVGNIRATGVIMSGGVNLRRAWQSRSCCTSVCSVPPDCPPGYTSFEEFYNLAAPGCSTGLVHMRTCVKEY